MEPFKEISAGGVVYRYQDQQLFIQLIQDRYGKITLPKGRMEPGETPEETALREIEEETGIQGTIVAPLEIITYRYRLPQIGQVHKDVHYFLVEAIGGTLHAQKEEIRGVEWRSYLEAWQLQKQSGYVNNDMVLRKALQYLGAEVEE